MTATLPKIPDPLTVLTRAERKATGEEPGDLSHLADAVRTHIIGPLTAGGTPVVDDVQVQKLLADKQRLDDLVKELRKTADTRGGVIDRQTREIAELKKSASELKHHVDEARAERDTARAQLRDQPASGADPAAVGQLQVENAELADQLATVQEQLSTTRRDLELANRTLDEIADEQESAPAAAPHRHQYEVDPKTGEHHACGCGQPWIRDLVDDGEPVEPDVEPWAELFGRIRAEWPEPTQ